MEIIPRRQHLCTYWEKIRIMIKAFVFCAFATPQSCDNTLMITPSSHLRSSRDMRLSVGSSIGPLAATPSIAATIAPDHIFRTSSVLLNRVIRPDSNSSCWSDVAASAPQPADRHIVQRLFRAPIGPSPTQQANDTPGPASGRLTHPSPASSYWPRPS